MNIGCDVKQLYPSIDSQLGLIAVENWLRLHPNPDGLPTNLIVELGKICVQENTCEFLGRFFCPNTGTATGPPHACDFADIFMGELDKIMVEKLQEANVENTGWTIFRDDGWLVATNGLDDVPVVENILQNLHPNIKWEVNPRGPSLPPILRADGTIEDLSTLEHLDLRLHFLDNQIETDVYAKDIPIYISRKSCHPPMVFPSIVKSVGLRLRANCSLDLFLSPRIEEYTNYFVASGYSRNEIRNVFEECRKVDRETFIKRPRRNKKHNAGPRKFVICPKWDPRAPNVREGLKMMEEVLYFNKENEKVFPKGSIIAGFKRQKNVGEMIAPTNPTRLPPPLGEKGCFPCNAPRACILNQSGVLQSARYVTSRYDGSKHFINKRLDCSTPHVVYYIFL